MACLDGTVTGDQRDCASKGVMGQHHYQKVLGEAREVEGLCGRGRGGRKCRKEPDQ